MYSSQDSVVSGVTAASKLSHTEIESIFSVRGLQTGLIGAAVALLIEFYRIQTDTGGINGYFPTFVGCSLLYFGWRRLFIFGAWITSSFEEIGS